MIKHIKYCKNINIPEILIDNKNAVEKENMKIFKNEIFSLLYALIKILIPMYVEKTHANRNGISVVLKKP